MNMQNYAEFLRNATPVQQPDQTYVPNLGVSLINAKAETAIADLLTSGRRRVSFMNAHCFNIMQENRNYAAAVHTADRLLPDGFGVALAAKMQGKELQENLNGTDLIPQLMEEAARAGKSVYLFGGKPGTATAAAKTLTQALPNLKIAGTRDGYAQAINEAAVINDINASGADIVLVALGVPMQELWLHRNAIDLEANLTIGVGAAFDFLAGNVRRAPQWVRQMRSEWIWRLAMEPRRMAKRYLVGNATFLARSVKRTVRQLKPAAVANRALDVCVSSAAAILLAPVFIATAIAVKLDSPGPVFFRQTRIGRDGKPFEMIKFRSMGVDAEARRAALLKNSDRDGICFKSKADPRITRVGRFIRRASIDELPQIFNVLRGQMAIVGPRPALPSEVAAYPKRAMGRLAVKPGITGVWQVSGRADIGFEQMVEMDLSYADTRNVLLDMIVIALTFRAVISGRGAH